jgi:hypothetical protein
MITNELEHDAQFLKRQRRIARLQRAFYDCANGG